MKLRSGKISAVIGTDAWWSAIVQAVVDEIEKDTKSER
jgi:hypothetical protein